MNPEVIEKIERYLDDEMQPQERMDFEKQLQEDVNLRNDFQLYTSINNTMKEDISKGEEKLTHTLKQMGRKYILQDGKVKKGNFKRWLAAAAAVFVIVFSAVYFLSKEKPSAEKLYASYAEHPVLQVQLRGGNADSLAGSAAGKFNNKNYSEALPLLQQYLQQQPGDIQMKFSEGICNLELNNYAGAENIFSTIASGQSAYAIPARWYLALTSLKQKDIEKCRIRLKAIPETSTYFNKAKTLLEKLPD